MSQSKQPRQAPSAPGASDGRQPRRGRRPSGMDAESRLERSRRSARECRARKKLRYLHLEELLDAKEHAVGLLNNELRYYEQLCQQLDEGASPSPQLVDKIRQRPAMRACQRMGLLPFGPGQIIRYPQQQTQHHSGISRDDSGFRPVPAMEQQQSLMSTQAHFQAASSSPVMAPRQ